MNKNVIIILISFFLIVNIANAAQVTGYFVIEPDNSTENTENIIEDEENIEEDTENNVPPITSSTVKEQENNLFDYIKNFFISIFSFFRK